MLISVVFMIMCERSEQLFIRVNHQNHYKHLVLSFNMKLIAWVGEDEGGLGQVSALLNRMDCDGVFLVKDKKTEKSFSKGKYVDVDCSRDLISLKEEMVDKLKKELSGDLEVALSLASGNGKEHMALISALLTVPVGVKLVAYTKKGV